MEHQAGRLPRLDRRPMLPLLGSSPAGTSGPCLLMEHLILTSVLARRHRLEPQISCASRSTRLRARDAPQAGRTRPVPASYATSWDRLRALTSTGSRKNEGDLRSGSQTRIRAHHGPHRQRAICTADTDGCDARQHSQHTARRAYSLGTDSVSILSLSRVVC